MRTGDCQGLVGGIQVRYKELWKLLGVAAVAKMAAKSTPDESSRSLVQSGSAASVERRCSWSAIAEEQS